jgi:hypothetical protein
MISNNLLINEIYYVTDTYGKIFVAKISKIYSDSITFNEYIDTDGTTDLSYRVIPICIIKNIKPLYEVNFINFKLNLQLDLFNVNKILLTLNKNFRYYIFFKENLNKKTKIIIGNYMSHSKYNILLFDCNDTKYNLGQCAIEINKINKIITLYDIVRNKKNLIPKDIWNYINMFI